MNRITISLFFILLICMSPLASAVDLNPDGTNAIAEIDDANDDALDRWNRRN